MADMGGKGSGIATWSGLLVYRFGSILADYSRKYQLAMLHGISHLADLGSSAGVAADPMNSWVSNASGVGSLIGVLVSAFTGAVVARQWYVHRNDETRVQREEREAKQREQDDIRRENDLNRIHAGLWKQIEERDGRIERLETRVRSAEDRAERAERLLEECHSTIRDLRAKIDMLEGRIGGDDD